MENPFENMRTFITIISLAIAVNCTAQNYHAVQGSPYAGSLGMANNPATMLNTPIRWDVNLIGFQIKSATNIFTIHNYSLLSNPANSEYEINRGDFARKGNLSFNTNFFNTRINLDRRHAIGFGVNIRGLVNIKSSAYNYSDSIAGARDFMNINDPARPLDARITGSSWVEIFGSYARTILDDQVKRLNTGITVRLSRGISGAYVAAENLRFQKASLPGTNILTTGRLSYGYSSNYDRWQKTKETRQNLHDLVAFSEGGMSIDFGVEYFIKTQAVTTFEDGDDYYDYNWRIGISLLDMGINQYKYGIESQAISGIIADVSDTLLDEKFRTVNSFGEVNDSLRTVVQSMNQLFGNFTVVNPMRLVVNADRPLGNDFYINGEVSLNLSNLLKKYRHVTEMNFITVTPRWETRRLGVYLPVQYNAVGKFWIGGAFKAGPLLLGVHNWGNVFGKKTMQNGGGYIALVIRAWNDTRNKTDRRLNCPPNIW
jgi:hypothetical protein